MSVSGNPAESARSLAAGCERWRSELNAGTLGGSMTGSEGALRSSFQDASFEVPYATGDVIEKLMGFADDADRPQKLLLHLRRAGWCSVFLDAFIAFWDALDDDQVADLHADYEGIALVDYGKVFQIEGAQVLAISCAQLAEASACIILQLDRGTLRLHALDPEDPHSESTFTWRAAIPPT
jgi:hypothetical protein